MNMPRTAVLVLLLLLTSRPLTGENVPWTGPATILGGIQYDDAVLCDVDMDGDLDVVAVADSPVTVRWAENGNSWFVHDLTTTAQGPVAIHIADVDHDGDPDILVADRTGDEIFVHLNLLRESGGFSAGLSVDDSCDGPVAIDSGDFDRDGNIDLASACMDGNEIKYHLGAGNGITWTNRSALTVAAANAVHVDNVFTNGPSDLLFSGADQDAGGNNIVGVAINFGFSGGEVSFSGQYLSSGNDPLRGGPVPGASLHYPRQVRFADLDGNGIKEFLVLSSEDSRFSRFIHDPIVRGGDYDFDSITTSVPDGRDFELNDVDLDGDLDVCVITETGWGWLENVGYLPTPDGTQLSMAWRERASGVFTNGSAIDTGDIDSDGDNDIIIASSSGVQWYRNRRPHSNDSNTPSIELDPSFPSNTSFSQIDLGPDGALDFVATNGGLNELLLFENTLDDGTSWDGSLQTVDAGSDPISGQPIFVTSADLDSGVYEDILFATASAIYWRQGYVFFENLLIYEETTSSLAGFDCRVADFDRDGFNDIAYVSDSLLSIYILYNNEAASWTRNVKVLIAGTAPIQGKQLESADLNADGHMDLLFLNEEDNVVAWINNNNDMRTALLALNALPTSGSTTPQAMATSDFDGDGTIDVVVGFSGTNQIVLYKNTAGDGSTWSRFSTSFGSDTFSEMTANDVDRDGIPELIIAGSHGVSIWQFNTTNNQFQLEDNLSNAAAQRVIVAEVSGDDYADIAFIESGDLKLSRRSLGEDIGFTAASSIRPFVNSSEEPEFMTLTATHHGLPFDATFELDEITMRWTRGDGTPYTESQLEALLNGIRISRTGGFSTEISDFPLDGNGEMLYTHPPDFSVFTVPPGTDAEWAIELRPKTTAHNQAVKDLRLEFGTSAFKVVNTTNRAVMEENFEGILTKTVRVTRDIESLIDEDGDGFNRGIEIAYNKSDTDSNSYPSFGDINDDGSTNMLDALIFARDLPSYKESLDINNNGFVTPIDFLLLHDWTIGVQPVLPVN